jgi:hypothetical protein
MVEKEVEKVPEIIYPILGGVRIAIGIGLIVSPTGLAKGLGVDAPTAKRVRWITRIAGAREIAVGVGTVRAWRRSEALDGWILAQAISDGSDAVAFTAAAVNREVGIVRGLGLAAFALSGALSEGWMYVRAR